MKMADFKEKYKLEEITTVRGLDDSFYWNILDNLAENAPNRIRSILQDGGMDHLESRLMEIYNTMMEATYKLQESGLMDCREAEWEVLKEMTRESMAMEQTPLSDEEMDQIQKFKDFHFE